MATPKKKTDKKAPAKKAAAKKAPAKKVPAKKAPTKKSAPKKKAAPKKVAKVSQTSTTTGTVDADVVWTVFQNESADVSATVNGKVIYANDVKPESVKKKFLAWFKR
jgi:multidrug efflux pump subunit AcrA (membrane-fusion protein)